MPPETPIAVDRAHYDLIVSTARDVKHICRMLDGIADRLEALENRDCPCEAVLGLSEDVELLQAQSAEMRGKIAVGVGILGIIAGWIGSLLPGWLGRV